MLTVWYSEEDIQVFEDKDTAKTGNGFVSPIIKSQRKKVIDCFNHEERHEKSEGHLKERPPEGKEHFSGSSKKNQQLEPRRTSSITNKNQTNHRKTPLEDDLEKSESTKEEERRFLEDTNDYQEDDKHFLKKARMTKKETTERDRDLRTPHIPKLNFDNVPGNSNSKVLFKSSKHIHKRLNLNEHGGMQSELDSGIEQRSSSSSEDEFKTPNHRNNSLRSDGSDMKFGHQNSAGQGLLSSKDLDTLEEQGLVKAVGLIGASNIESEFTVVSKSKSSLRVLKNKEKASLFTRFLSMCCLTVEDDD